MAKAYHKLSKNELNISRMTELSLLAKKAAQASNGATKSNKVIGLKQRTHKSINKRQKRKKMIRDELKRQLGIFHFKFRKGEETVLVNHHITFF